MINKLYEFYKGKKVLITGHNGFKGSWLTLWLKKMGAKVIGVSLTKKKGELYDQLGMRIEKEYVCDIGQSGDSCDIYTIMNFEKPYIVFHLAAQPLVRYSYDYPIETYQTNVMGTMNVLNAMRLAGVKNGVMITTDKCYRNDDTGRPMKEDDPFGGEDPYSSSKGCCEILIESMRSSYKELNFVKSARAGNVVGGGDYALDRIIPDFFRAFESGTQLELRNPYSTRPWQHVLEPLYGYLLLGMMNNIGGFGVNFGPNPTEAHNVGEVIDRLNEAIHNRYGKYVDIVKDKPDASKKEAMLLQLDNSLARRVLDWSPVFSFEETIDSIARWFYICEHGLGLDAPHKEELLLDQGVNTKQAFYACMFDIDEFERKLK